MGNDTLASLKECTRDTVLLSVSGVIRLFVF